jgi:hypothetical protein
MNFATRLFGRINCSILFLMLIACPFLLIGLSEVYKTAQMTRNFVATRGTVVDNVWRPFAHGGAAYVPVVDFQTRDGQAVRFTDGIGTFPPEYEVGAQVNVLYDPSDVQNARVTSWKRIWFAPTLITSIGMLPILIAIGLAWLMRRRTAPQRHLITPNDFATRM